MNRTQLRCALIVALLVPCGCSPAPLPGNANSGQNTNFNSSVDVNLGANSEFDLTSGAAVERQVRVSLASELGVNGLSGLGFAISEDQVTIVPDNPGNLTSNGLTTLDLFIAPADVTDACSSGINAGRFAIAFDTTETLTITPAQLDADANALAAAGDGVFELCLRAASGIDQSMIVNRLQVRFDAATPSLTCAEILALSQVQAAITLLEENDLTFALQDGHSPRNIEATYEVRETIEFDPDHADTGTRQRLDILSGQTADHITRTTGSVGLEQSISGGQDGVNLCVLARSHNSTCDQTIARLESYEVLSNGQTLDGTFLAVVVERHTTGTTTCGQQGDFIYGAIDLTRQSTTFQVTRLARIVLPEDFDPDLLLLPSDGSRGTVTDYRSDAALQFPQDGTAVTRALAVPGGLDADRYNGIALARDNSLLALVSENPYEMLVFDNTTGSLTVEATAHGAVLGGDVFDFSNQNQFVYVVRPEAGDGHNLFVFRTTVGFTEPVGSFTVPDGQTPELSRLNPAGDQLAVLLDGEAGETASQWLTFHDVNTGLFSAPIDLHEATGGFVGDRDLIYNNDGSRVFLAGDFGVVAVETSAPFTVTNIDVSGGERDFVVAIDLSNDGQVIVAAVDRVDGDANFAIVETDTLAVVNRQLLDRVSDRGAIDVAHFDTGRACIVVNERERVVAVQTVAPFAVSEELSAADDELAVILGRAAAGGSVIAVANVSEPAVYLYRLAP